MKTIIANWKMHLGIRESLAHTRGVLQIMMGHETFPDVILCPSFTALSEVRKVLVRTRVRLGAQTMGPERFGAFTGEVSVAQLDDAGCQWVMLGHSERRLWAGETDAMVNAKMKLIAQTSLMPILCVGEPDEVRRTGKAEEFVTRQITEALQGVRLTNSARMIVAYEPVWAIGRGTPAMVADVLAMHQLIRRVVLQHLSLKEDALSVVYGGAIDGENAYQFLREPLVNGVLVGGASMKLQEFEKILLAGRDVMLAQSQV